MNCLLSGIHTGTPLVNTFLILISSFESPNPFPANLVHQHHDQKDHQANHRHDNPDTETLTHPRPQSHLHVRIELLVGQKDLHGTQYNCQVAESEHQRSVKLSEVCSILSIDDVVVEFAEEDLRVEVQSCQTDFSVSVSSGYFLIIYVFEACCEGAEGLPCCLFGYKV